MTGLKNNQNLNSKMPNSTRQLALSLCSLLILSACGNKNDKKITPSTPTNRQMVMNVDVVVTKTESIAENIEVPGSVIANETTEIHPEVSGRIIQLNVAEGRYVSKGALLAKLYDADLQAQLKKLEVQLQIAQSNEERSAQLLKIQGISKQDYDASLLNVNNIKADIDITKTSISKTEIRAPFNGKLGLRNISPGAYVTPSTVIAVINQVNQLKLDFTVPEKYTGQIKLGQVVSFSFEGSQKQFKARVSAMESNVTVDTRSLTVRAIVENKDQELLPGAFAKVQLSFAPNPDAIMNPTQAVLPQARGKKVVLFDNGTAKFVDVTTGVRDSARVEITSGLKPGDTVVITGLLSVRPGAKIKANKMQ